jgi:4-amino-4-deoxy-L-arabinose transferase-like glycosyltransferase
MNRGAAAAAWSVAAVVAILYLLVAGRYGIFVNELYFIVCGRHPAFGYVDQPPLVPLLSALMQIGGVNVWVLRLPAVLAAVLLVPLTVIFAVELGATTRGAWLAAVATASASLVSAMTATLSTSTFEPFDFTATALLVTRAILRNSGRSWWWAGAFVGFALETKYTIALWAIGLAIGIAACGPRSVARSRDLWIGVAIAAVIALPNAIWQAAHGFPFLELVRNDNAGNLIGGPVAFTLQQVFAVNIVLAPLWVTGIVAPFARRDLARFRYLSVAFVVTVVLIYVTHGKMYYVAGAYPSMFALGAAAATMLPRALVAAWAVLAAANGALALPLVLPVDSPARLKTMLDRAAFRPRPVEAAGIGAPLMQVFSDEFGWPELAQSVERAYMSLPQPQRSRTAIYAATYGEAAAIDVYGHGLPPAISGNNQYFLWGPRGFDGSSVLAVNEDPSKWTAICASVRVIARYGDSPYAMPFDVNRPILLCTGMRPALPQLWPQFKHYGVEFPGPFDLPRV